VPAQRIRELERAARSSGPPIRPFGSWVVDQGCGWDGARSSARYRSPEKCVHVSAPLSIREFCRRHGLRSKTQVTRWRDSGLAPHGIFDNDGRIAHDGKAWRAFQSYQRERPDVRRAGRVERASPDDYLAQRTRRERATADKLEFELDLQRGRYVVAADARSAAENLFVQIRDRLLGLHVKIAQRYFNQVIDHAAVAEIQEIVREELEALATDKQWWTRVRSASRARGLPVEEDDEKVRPTTKKIDKAGRR
jgi:hypothetical protein